MQLSPRNPVRTDATLTALARILIKRAKDRDSREAQPLGEIVPVAVAEILDRPKAREDKP
jgi:hypothetical protein